jgi:hypothetical protein
MADNVPITPGSGKDIATDDVGAVHYQKIKVDLGGDGVSSPLVRGQQTMANSIPVTVASNQTGQKVQLTDGTSDATVRNLAANDALNVAIVDGAGNQVTSFAGSGGSSATDNSAFTAGTTADTTMAGFYQSTPSAVTDGRSAAIGITALREMKISLTSSALDVSHDAVDTGDPALIGMRAQSALPASVANNDRARAISDLQGRQLVSHIDPTMQAWKNFNATTTQTGAIIWNPAAGKKIAITHFTIGSYGTTAARLIMYFGADADTTYDGGTDQLVFAASYAPSTTSKPGTVMCPAVPIFAATVDHSLHITTDAALSVDVAVYGYEFTP